MDAERDTVPATRTVRIPRWTHRDTSRGLLVALPLVLGGSFGPALGAVPSSWTGSVDGTTGHSRYLDSLTGPVPDAGATPDPGTAVVPVGGDPQNLALGTPSAATAVPLATAPAVGDTRATAGLTASGIPLRTLQAYLAAAATTARTTPGCHLHWSLLAGIGRVETNHGRFGNARIAVDGRVSPPIYGPRLSIHDTDGGRLDALADSDRAVGPMQFLPGTWAMVGADSDGDGTADPQDVDDAALSAARYLCLGKGDLGTASGRWNAVFRYNRSSSYVSLVLALADSYATGKAAAIAPVPAGATATVPAGSPAAAAPPTLPGLTATAAPTLASAPAAVPSVVTTTRTVTATATTGPASSTTAPTTTDPAGTTTTATSTTTPTGGTTSSSAPTGSSTTTTDTTTGASSTTGTTTTTGASSTTGTTTSTGATTTGATDTTTTGGASSTAPASSSTAVVPASSSTSLPPATAPGA